MADCEDDEDTDMNFDEDYDTNFMQRSSSEEEEACDR
jgi:hypothetical protein